MKRKDPFFDWLIWEAIKGVSIACFEKPLPSHLENLNAL